MPKQPKLPDPARFGIQSFAELLSTRPAVLGEVAGSFDPFREGLIASLIPVTPYECVVAENLIAIEWELVQRRRMYNAEMREDLRFRIKRAVEAHYKVIHDAALDADWRAFIDAGGYKNDWQEPHLPNKDVADAFKRTLDDRCMTNDPVALTELEADLAAMGIFTVTLMSAAYASTSGTLAKHDAKIPELERRRREVRRDYDALQSARPLEHLRADHDIPDAEVISP
ncbi:hypothetical protein [Yoonia vestfoldensis]|uniref:Uncharacterized protein n=1 Tax=Yoonia vestfoldensis SKA53 TaxID=314232 RepID=A3V686_9RHOB|nr:hypothetical protein [Yoonia vestfoldensis]EAQ06410.1 hypothetical protein SKA53_04963 [Yoonia vestfoldensis SKA53]